MARICNWGRITECNNCITTKPLKNISCLLASSRPAGFSFLGKPQDTQLSWGQSTILEALADSAKPVTYTWYKDGQPIILDAKKSIVGEGNLKLLYVDEKDAGVYKVVANSDGQSTEASASLSVICKWTITLQRVEFSDFPLSSCIL